MKRFFQVLAFLTAIAFSFTPAYSSTRAIQIDIAVAGFVNPTTSEPVALGSVYFYEAGTTTAKNVWTEKEKTNAYTSYTLDGVGAAQLYGEGNYKIVIKDLEGATVDTLDNIRLRYPNYYIHTITQTYSQLSEDDFILVNTTGGDVTINCLTSASWEFPIKVRRVAGSNNIIIDPYGSETIDGAATLTISSDAIVEIIPYNSNLSTAGFRSSFADADNDTKIQVEESADEDKVRIDTGGTERVVVDSSGLDVVSGGILRAGTDIKDVTETLTNKTISAATLSGTTTNSGTISGGTVNPTTLQKGGVNVPTISETATLTNKTISGATLSNTTTNSGTVSGGTVNATTLQQGSVQALTASNPVTVSGKNFSQATTVTFTNTGDINFQRVITKLSPNLSTGYSTGDVIGVAESSQNCGEMYFYYAGSGSASNYLAFGLYGHGNDVRIDGSGNLGVGKTSSGAKLDVDGEVEGTSLDINGNSDFSGTVEIHDTLTLSKASGNGIVVTSDIDANGNQDLAGTLDIGSGTTRRVAPAGTFVNNASGSPNISNTSYDVDANLTESAWESFGPTSSGKDNIWSALDSVPTDAHFVILKVNFYSMETSGDTSTSYPTRIYARKNGSSEAADDDTMVAAGSAFANSAGNAETYGIQEFRCPVSSSSFDLEWYAAASTSVDIKIYLIGWGFNP